VDNQWAITVGGNHNLTFYDKWDTGIQHNLTSGSTWSSSATNIATASAGLVHGVAAGAVTVNGVDQSEPWAGQQCGDPPQVCPADAGVDGGGGSGGSVRPVISGPNTVWWFNGQNPSGYATSITLTSTGGNGVIWGVIAGAAEVNIHPTGNTVAVTSSGSTFSSGVGDVQITAQVNSETSVPFHITTRTPYRLANKQTQASCDSGFGYLDLIEYNIQDQLLTNVPSAVPWNEAWTTQIVDDDAPNDNWSLYGRPTETGGTDTLLKDYISGVGVNNNPAPSPMPACAGTVIKIQHWGQEFRVGSTSSGLGQPVQTDNLTRFAEHAEHD
jgi:hypothetical protein